MNYTGVRHYFCEMIKHFFLFCILASLLFPAAAGAATVRGEFERLIADSKLQSGKQAMCFLDPDGKEISHNGGARIIPASVTKLYVFDFALATLPEDFRYETEFIRNGTTLYINGGGDPHFVIEHLRSVIEKVRDDSGVTLNKFVISPDFYFNWQSNPKDVQMAVFRALKADRALPIAPRIEVSLAAAPYKGKGTRYEFSSAPLPELLKQINEYSTNISAEVLFQKLGGSSALSAYLKKTYGVGTDTAYFGTGSGLTANYTTCDLTLRVLEHLHEQLDKRGWEPTDVLSVPTVDPGVLSKRAIDQQYATSLVAKSGFVNNHHTLAGIINTKDGPAYFGVFTTYVGAANNAKTKSMIDRFVTSVLAMYKKTLKPFEYEPDTPSVKGYRIAKK